MLRGLELYTSFVASHNSMRKLFTFVPDEQHFAGSLTVFLLYLDELMWSSFPRLVDVSFFSGHMEMTSELRFSCSACYCCTFVGFLSRTA